MTDAEINADLSVAFPGIVFLQADANAPVVPVGWTLFAKFIFDGLESWIFRNLEWILILPWDDREIPEWRRPR